MRAPRAVLRVHPVVPDVRAREELPCRLHSKYVHSEASLTVRVRSFVALAWRA